MRIYVQDETVQKMREVIKYYYGESRGISVSLMIKLMVNTLIDHMARETGKTVKESSF